MVAKIQNEPSDLGNEHLNSGLNSLHDTRRNSGISHPWMQAEF
jgi:hypothetical protein